MNALQAERHPVDRLAEEFVDRYRRGERPAISDYTQKYPELASELQEILAALVLIEEHGRAQVIPGLSSGSGRLPDTPAPVQLGEYRVLREIGRGGMGVVYEAVQESLGRHVALKVLPSHALLDAVRLKRFQHEAQAAARLHHTNIVPIFGVGTAEGVHFYAMQFIQGRGLDEVIEELRELKRNEKASGPRTGSDNGSAEVAEPTIARANLSTMSDTPRYYRSVANLGAQVAEALDHAHRQGVLHRDIKPSNLLLDAAGTVWITDFGLAKAEGTEELTQSGDLVGTLRYIAPEQLRGKADGRADIYSLGSTLYELLTLRPAFNAPDRAALIRQIVQDDPVRPRRLDARIPRDLETIVLKAMTHDPASRYSSAAAMATDLRHFLDDKPIAARPVGVPERVWRWCVRRPALASLTGALLTSLVIGIAGILWQWGRAETNLNEAVRQKSIAVDMLGMAQQQQRRAEQEAEEAARQGAIAERKAAEAEASYQTARKAIDEIALVSENKLLAQPGLQPVRLQLLTGALQFYEEQLADRDQDLVARRSLARSYLRLGAMKHELGPAGPAASDAYRQAIALLQPAEAQVSEDRATTIWLARAENQLGQNQIDRHQRREAAATLAQSRQRLERLLERTPDDEAAQATLADMFQSLGYLISLSTEIPYPDRFEQAIEFHDRALTIYRQLFERHPEDAIAQYNISVSLSNKARRYQALKRHSEDRALLEECLRIRQDVAQRRPDILEFQYGVGATFNALGDVIRDSDLPVPERVKLAIEHYERALEIAERMVRENPAVLRYWQEVTNITTNVSDLCSKHRFDQQALDWRRKEIAALDSCLALDPTDAELCAKRAERLNGQALLEFRLGLYAESLNSRIRSREAWRQIQQDPAQLAANRASILANLSALMTVLSWHDRAAQLCTAARERCELVDETPTERLLLSYELERHLRAGRRGPAFDDQVQAAVAEFQHLAIKLFRNAAQTAPREMEDFVRTRPSMRPYSALVKLDEKIESAPLNMTLLVDRAQLLRKLGDEAASLREEEETLRLIENALEADPKNVTALRDRATLHFNAGRWEQAIAECARGLDVAPSDYALLRINVQASLRLEQWQQVYDACSRILEIRADDIVYWPLKCRAAWELGHTEEALADARNLIVLAQKNPKNADFVVWEFLKQHDVVRYPETALTIAQQAAKRHDKDNKDNVYRGELGAVQSCLGQYQKAIANLQPAAAQGPSVSSALAGFCLAMSYHHLGELDKAEAAFSRAVRNWKGMGAAHPEEEDLTRSLWQEAQTLLGNSVTQAEPRAS